LTGRVDVALGSAGLAVAFKDESYTMVAWRAAGSGDWSVEEVFHHDYREQLISAAVGADGPMVVTDVDAQFPDSSPNGFALLERSDAGWAPQLLAGRVTAVGEYALDVDAEGEPVIAITFDSGLYFLNVIGTYPEDWAERCQAAAAEMCLGACQCGVDNEECCWGLGGSRTCTSNSGCPGLAADALCGVPIVSPEELQLCHDELGSLTCNANGALDLSGACAPLYHL
jgi:hypothetical protein